MRKFLLFIALVLSFPALAQAQVLPATANLTASDAGTCATANACLSVNINSSTGSAVLSIGGTFSATAQFEGVSAGATTYTAVACVPIAGGSAITSATTATICRVTASALTNIRIRISAFTSGPVAAGISTSTASASLGAGGGGGGGGITSVSASAPLGVTNPTTTPNAFLTVGTGCAPGQFSTGLDSLTNSLCSAPATTPPGQPPYVGPTAVNGCGVEWTGLLTFTVGQCTYIINGTTYTSAITNLTLAAADPTNPRIDDIIVDNTGTASAITGTPAASPVAPTVDPSTQLALTFVTIAANATTPTSITKVDIYHENTEWTTATGGTNSARVNVASTNNPYDGTVDIEFGNGGTVTTTTFVGLTDPASGTVDLAASNSLVFYIRNKAAFPNNRSVTIQWFNGSTAKGVAIVLSNGNFGFNAASNFTTYQQINIPTSYFQINGVPVTSVRFTVTGTGAALTGFYLDDITLQAGINTTPPLPTTLMNFRGTYSSAVQYNPNDTVVVNGCDYIALVANLNVAVTTTSTWAGTGSCATAKTGQVLTAQNGAPSQFLTPGIADGNGGAAVTSSPYTLKCDSSTAVLDGAHLIRFQSGAATVTVPLSTATGCTGNNMAFTIVDDGAGTLTVNRTSADTFSTFNGSTATDGATSFTLTSGSYATLNQGAAGIWEVRIVPASGSGSVSSVVIAGTANQVAVSGTCTITSSGTCTLAFPSTIVIPNGSTATTQTVGDNSTKPATTAFVQSAVTASNPAVAVLAASTANVVGTYTPVGSGIGDTFTVTATGTFSLDGVAINTIGQRILLKNQSTAFQNGVYTATVVGVSLVSPVFTRALDYDQPSDINTTGAIPVQSGTVNSTTSWLLTSTVNTIGSDALTYVQFSYSPSATCIPGPYAAQTDAATVTWAIGTTPCANASLLFTTHGGSRTLNLTGMTDGGNYILVLTQDGTGGEGLTLGTGCTWKVSGGGSGAITPSTGASAIDILTWSYKASGTVCLANFNKNFN